ncbi:MAG: hypothetical protein ACXWGY_03135 [Chthoniobacterales bacterium]
MMTPVEYYADPNVRTRISEFLGGRGLNDATCRYLACGEGPGFKFSDRRALADLPNLFANGTDIERSLLDSRSLIADLDIEYVNFDHPAEAYLQPARIFELQRPVQETVERLLKEYGIRPLHFLTGRGHHFVWSIRQDSALFARLTSLGRAPPSLWRHYAQEKVNRELGGAFAGLGMMMEFLAGRVKWQAAPRSKIPVELTAIEVGPSDHGREMISIDISEYGDPLDARILRTPFSVYLKPWHRPGAIPDHLLDQIKPLFCLPLQELTMKETLPAMRDAEAMVALAARAKCEIPDASEACENLLDDYETSALKKFHDRFYAQDHLPPEDWPQTYDRVPLELMPACCRLIFEQPNDLLLRPACILRAVRVLLALGWHPRHIAGFITSKYERDFHWTQFEACDPATRADFYVRVFAGLFATGGDDMIDFNCASAREEGICFFNNCNDNLLRFRASALARREHDQLASGPFNRLLLSK